MIPATAALRLFRVAGIAACCGFALATIVGFSPAPQAQRKAGRTATRDDGHDHGRTYQGRDIADVMSFQGADWLLRSTRTKEEQPDRMLAALGIQKGSTVADVGAGVGFHALKLARLVGPRGTVLATDVQPEMIEMMNANVAKAKVANVRTILCTQNETGLPDNAIDLALMVDVYHECSNPETTLAGLKRALKPGGRLVLVEFRGEDPEVPIKPEHKMTVRQVRTELEGAGFEFDAWHDFLPWQHIIVFRKPKVE